jgi:hypothetical protein
MNRILAATALALSLGSAEPYHPLERLWNLLASFGEAPTAEEGCGADPNGRCIPEPQPQSKEGCGADPNGKPKPCS